MFIASVRLSVRLSVCLSVCPSVCLSETKIWSFKTKIWRWCRQLHGSGPEKLISAPRSTSSILPHHSFETTAGQGRNQHMRDQSTKNFKILRHIGMTSIQMEWLEEVIESTISLRIQFLFEHKYLGPANNLGGCCHHEHRDYAVMISRGLNTYVRRGIVFAVK